MGRRPSGKGDLGADELGAGRAVWGRKGGSGRASRFRLRLNAKIASEHNQKRLPRPEPAYLPGSVPVSPLQRPKV